jgi:FkbM family methyltransferase
MSQAEAQLLDHVQNMEKLAQVYDLLADDYSKELFVELLKFRILGSQHVKLPVNNGSFWKKYHSVDENYLRERATTDTGRFVLDLYEIKGSDGPMKVHATSLGILAVFLLEEYGYNKSDKAITVQSGDVVIDGGACWGETSLYFADKAGPEGKVFAFEFVEGNVKAFEKNMRSNEHLCGRIDLVKKALWSESGESLSYSERGPSTSVLGVKGTEPGLRRAETVAIDDFVRDKEIEGVDFIKMDIEGSELNALRGAEKTIKRFRPKLAISIYHKHEDFFEIPLHINDLGANYEFYVHHVTIYGEETILFCQPKAD